MFPAPPQPLEECDPPPPEPPAIPSLTGPAAPPAPPPAHVILEKTESLPFAPLGPVPSPALLA